MCEVYTDHQAESARKGDVGARLTFRAKIVDVSGSKEAAE